VISWNEGVTGRDVVRNVPLLFPATREKKITVTGLLALPVRQVRLNHPNNKAAEKIRDVGDNVPPLFWYDGARIPGIPMR